MKSRATTKRDHRTSSSSSSLSSFSPLTVSARADVSTRPIAPLPSRVPTTSSDTLLAKLRTTTPTYRGVPSYWDNPGIPFSVADLPSLEPIDNPALDKQVFTHRAALDPIRGSSNKYNVDLTSYEPLEWHGDALVKSAVADLLRRSFPTANPGVLSNLASLLVRNHTLAYLAWVYGFSSRLNAGNNKGIDNTPLNESQDVMADAFEAYVGALAESEPVGSGCGKAQNWLRSVFSLQSFPTLDREAVRLEQEARGVLEARTVRRDEGNLELGRQKHAKLIEALDCDGSDHPDLRPRMRWQDVYQASEGSHSVLFVDERRRCCGRGAKQVDARGIAIARALIENHPFCSQCSAARTE